MNSLRLNMKAPSEAELLIYGDIGESWFDDESVTAKKVVAQLNGLDAKTKTIKIRINSFGGAVSDALAIVSALKAQTAKKIVIVDGVAISAGSLIAMAGDEIHMNEGSLMMIHAPWGGASGNAAALRKTAEVMDKWAEAMVSIYTTKTGKTEDEIRSLLTDGEDHWYTAREAVSAGFADKIVGETATRAVLQKAPFAMQQLAMAAYRATAFEVKMEDTPVETPAEAPAAETAAPVACANCSNPDCAGCEPQAAEAAEAAETTPAPEPEPEAHAEVPAEPQASAKVDDVVAKAVEAALAAAQAKSEAALKEMQAKLDFEIEMKETAKVQAEVKAAFQFLPQINDDFGSAIRAMRKASPESCAKIEAVLQSANALLADPVKAQMTPIGSASAKTDDSPAEKVQRLAQEKLKAGNAKTIEAARVLVYNENPELVRAVRGED